MATLDNPPTISGKTRAKLAEYAWALDLSLRRWKYAARPSQRLPEQDFFVWLLLAGRGFGKTRTGAETTISWSRENNYVNLVGATADDARDIMIEGESGILASAPNDWRPEYIPSKRQLRWPNGATSLIFTADEPQRLRGKQHSKIWADEIAAWRYPEAWTQAMLGLRLGKKPQAVVTTTPKPTKLIKDLVGDPKNIVTRGTTYDNRANLAPGFYDYVISRYEETRLGRQELLAEIIDDNPDALWGRNDLDAGRVTSAPDMERVVVGVDPSASGDGDEAGVVAAGIVGDNYYILADDSIRGLPDIWARAAVAAYHRHHADLMVAEKNNGGEMVRSVIFQVDPTVNLKLVSASRGKYVRAEPVSMFARQGRHHHVGFFAALEDELCEWAPGAESPNRLDALVWALTELSAGSGGWLFD